MKHYKVFITNIIRDMKSEAILVDDFETIRSAKIRAKSHIISDESYFIVREYDNRHNNIIGGGDLDTGVTVYDSRENKKKSK